MLVFLLSVSAGQAQTYRVLMDKDGEVPVIDLSDNGEGIYEVARKPNEHINYPSAVLTGTYRDEILASYISTDTTRRICLTRSTDGGRTWTEMKHNDNWTNPQLRSLSMFNLGKPILKRRDRENYGRNNLMLFSGGNPLRVSATYTNGDSWCNFYPANNFGSFRISGMTQLKDGRLMALFHDDGRFLYQGTDSLALRKSVIYKIYSSDGGLTWSKPEIALRHNIYGLYDGVVIRSSRKNQSELVVISSERTTSAAYISFSNDEGETWSYPEKLPKFIQGDRFGIATLNRELFIAFRDMCRTLNDGTINPTFGDLVMWTGDLQELVKGNKNGIKIRLADNYPSTSDIDLNDRKFFDCGYASVLPLSTNELAVIAYGRWDAAQLPYIKNFIVDPKMVRKLVRKM